MANSVRAKITWFPISQGGRRVIKEGQLLVASRFTTEQQWTLVVNIKSSPDINRVVYADVQFLISDAPFDLLHTGATFDLMEGLRVIASGVVLDGAE